jgi:nucleolar protein 9
VWRNWRMDLYKRKRGDWVKQSKWTVGNDGFQSFPESNGDSSATPPHHQQHSQNQRGGKHMSAIELARQKHASKAVDARKKEAHAEKKSNGSISSKGKEKVAVAAQ